MEFEDEEDTPTTFLSTPLHYCKYCGRSHTTLNNEFLAKALPTAQQSCRCATCLAASRCTPNAYTKTSSYVQQRQAPQRTSQNSVETRPLPTSQPRGGTPPKSNFTTVVTSPAAPQQHLKVTTPTVSQIDPTMYSSITLPLTPATLPAGFHEMEVLCGHRMKGISLPSTYTTAAEAIESGWYSCARL